MSKDVYYFSHDSNARNDEKILMLRAEHGMEGYGIYWALLECMFESKDSKIMKEKLRGLAMSFNIDITTLLQVVNTCITEGLFETDDMFFWSNSMIRRKELFHKVRDDLREKRSNAGKIGMAKRWGNRDGGPDVKQEDNNDITNVINTDNKRITKVKESKVNEIKEKDNNSIGHLTDETDSGENVDKLPEPVKKQKVKRATDADIERVWGQYPKKTGKAESRAKIAAAIAKHGVDAVIEAVKRYADEVKERDPQYIKAGKTFFNAAYEDYIGGDYAPAAKLGPLHNKKTAETLGFTEREYDFGDLEKKLLGRE